MNILPADRHAIVQMSICCTKLHKLTFSACSFLDFGALHRSDIKNKIIYQSKKLHVQGISLITTMLEVWRQVKRLN